MEKTVTLEEALKRIADDFFDRKWMEEFYGRR